MPTTTTPPAGQVWKNYIQAGGQRVAVRAYTATTSEVTFLLSDHLGSTSVSVNGDGSLRSEVRYTAYGEARYTSGDTPTHYRYTGQLSQMDSIGLYFYQSRFYDPALSHFVSSDSIVPDPYNPGDWNRYSYVRYNPIRYVDPTGHASACGFSYSDPECKEKPKNPIIPVDDLNALILSVYVETSMGEHPDWSINGVSHVAINRYRNYYSDDKKVQNPYFASYYDYEKKKGGELAKVTSGNRNYLHVRALFMKAYEEDLSGVDPTNGSIFFIHGRRENVTKGKVYKTIEDARSVVEKGAVDMASGYTDDMAKRDGQLPFQYYLSEPYKALGHEMFLFTGTHICVPMVSCGKGWIIR